MAKAPFQTSGSAPEIAPAQVRGGFTPAPGIAETVADVAGAVLPELRQDMEDNITEGIQESAKSVRLGLQATRFPSLHDTIFSKEALANPGVKQALAEYTLIQDAVSQGKLPSNYATARLELIQNQAIAQSPEFEQEIRGAMRDAAGFDPKQTIFAQLMKEPKQTLTPEQQANLDNREGAAKLGITVEKFMGMNLSLKESAVRSARIDAAVKEAKYDVAIMGSDVANQSSLIMANALEFTRKMVVAGQEFTPDVKLQLQSRVKASVAASRASLVQRTKGMPISGDDVNAQLASLDSMQENLLAMIEDNTILTMTTEGNDTIVAMNQDSILNNNELSMAFSIAGGRGLTDYLTAFNQMRSSPEGKALAAEMNKDLRGILKLQDVGAGVLKQLNQLGTNIAPVTKGDHEARFFAGATVLGTKDGNVEFQLGALDDMRKYGGDELTFAAYDSNKILTATASNSRLKAAFINLHESTSAGLSQKLLQLAATPDVDLDRLHMENGVLVVAPREVAERTLQSQTARSADTDMSTFAASFNRANKISAKYSGAGVLPTARYTNTERYWDTISSAAAELAPPEVPINEEVIKFVRDANGKLVLAPTGE